MKFILWINDAESEPYESESIQEAIAAETLPGETLARLEHGIQWKPISDLLTKFAHLERKDFSRTTPVQSENVPRNSTTVSNATHKKILVSIFIGIVVVAIGFFFFVLVSVHEEAEARQRQEEARQAQLERESQMYHDAAFQAAANLGSQYALIYQRKPTEDELEKLARQAFEVAKASNGDLHEDKFVEAYSQIFAHAYDFAYQKYSAPAF